MGVESTRDFGYADNANASSTYGNISSIGFDQLIYPFWACHVGMRSHFSARNVVPRDSVIERVFSAALKLVLKPRWRVSLFLQAFHDHYHHFISIRESISSAHSRQSTNQQINKSTNQQINNPCVLLSDFSLQLLAFPSTSTSTPNCKTPSTTPQVHAALGTHSRLAQD